MNAFNPEQFGARVDEGFDPNAFAAPVKIKENKLGFLDRLKLSFSTKEQRDRELVEPKGFMKGGIKEFAGDMADVAGAALPLGGAVLGAAGGALAGFGVGAVPGAAIGAGAGESVRRTIGQAIGVRDDATPLDELIGPVKESAITLVGGQVLKYGGKYIASRLPKVLGIITGESDDAVRAALSNPKAADSALTGGDDALRVAVQKAGDGAIKLKDSFIKGHTAAMNKIFGSAGGARPVDQNSIVGQFESLLKGKGIKINAKPNSVQVVDDFTGATRADEELLDFTTSRIIANPGERGKINSAYNAIKNWDDWTASGMHELKQLMGGLTKFATETGGTSKSPTIGSFYNVVNDSIKNTLSKAQKKQYELLNKNFSDNIDLFDDMVSALNGNDPFTKVAGMFAKNRDSLRQILMYYEKQAGSQPLSGIVAGRELAMEKSAAFGFLNPRAWIDLFFSPAAQARVVTGSGRAGAVIRKGGEVVKDAVQAPGKTVADFLSR